MYEIRIFTQFGTILKSDWPTMGTALKHWELYKSASTCTITTPSGEVKHFFNPKRKTDVETENHADKSEMEALRESVSNLLVYIEDLLKKLDM